MLARRDQRASDEDAKPRVHVDVFEDLGSTVRVVGWGFVGERSGVRLVFRGDGAVCAVAPAQRARADVAAAHRLASDEVGFDQTIDKRDLPAGRSRLTVEIDDALGTTHVVEMPFRVERP